MKKIAGLLTKSIGIFTIALGLGLFIGRFEAQLTQFFVNWLGRRPSPNWPGYFAKGGVILICLGGILFFFERLISILTRLRSTFSSLIEIFDKWLEQKFGRLVDFTAGLELDWPLKFRKADWIAILIFSILAITYQLHQMGAGFPTVILGGDAANLASFAAGQSYPNLFQGDAILGNLSNIGLYVTIHVPLVILLEKILGNFGLAFSVLLAPHVFMQFLAYYLFGRVLFKNRYWAFLFTFAIAAPLHLPGGELWGVMEDAMPRFTYQILLPFLLILILTTWRNQPQRWPWLMVMAGLLAFVHPVSTPTWAFALWLGFWAIFPDGWNTYRKLLELAKLGLVLALALLPYVLIYFHYHQSGSNSNYDLVYYVISEYFPTNILNMRGALIQLYAAVAQNGLLWVGLFGMLVTFFIFHTVWPYIRQMLYWVAGIIIITILVPWGEQVIEHSLRMVPLQTEIMRGMRYLVLFVFIFAFLPFAELTRRLHSRVIKYMVLLIGSAATIGWLLVNPPYPLSALPVTIQCFAKEKIICPYDLEYADVLKQIQVQTPLRSKFVVFLQNRWSGIEVRYLSLRPMAYAYKDKGQLAFTNIPALEQWLEFQKKEDMIFKDRFSPTLEQKFERIDRFARNAGADYVLTNFPFTSEDQNRVGLRIIYQNQEYSILKIIR